MPQWLKWRYHSISDCTGFACHLFSISTKVFIFLWCFFSKYPQSSYRGHEHCRTLWQTISGILFHSNECSQCSYNFYSNDAEAQLSVLYLYFRISLTAFLMARDGSTNCCWRKCFFILMVFPISMNSFLLYCLLSVCPHHPLFLFVFWDRVSLPVLELIL